MKPVLILRPEPGNQATARRAAALGLQPLQYPLFAIEPVAWTAPDGGGFDALLLTSANAVRHGGAQLAGLKQLDTLAVGPATAAAARAAGFRVVMTGDQGIDALLDALPGERRLLQLGGVDRHQPADTRHHVEAIAVYRASQVAQVLPDADMVALVHSARAGARLKALAPRRPRIAIAALSAGAAASCGPGWAAVEWCDQPSEAALLALAARLCQD